MTDQDPLEPLRSLARDRWSAGRKARLARPKPRQRLDLALATLVLGLGAAGGATGALWSAWEAAHGLFDPPLFQPVEDRRILSDFRSDPAPFMDALVLGPRLVAAREDGALVGYDPATEAIDEGRFFAGPDLVGALAGLSAGCAGPESCPDPGALFAQTKGGGLARGDAGLSAWSVVLSDRPWTGQDGQPVTQDDIRLWAVEDGGTWVLAWAGPKKGLGLFDQRKSSWTSLAAADVTALIPGPGLFWLGSAKGLLRLAPGEAAPTPIEGGSGEVLSLERRGAGALALVQGTCAGKGQGCLSLVQVEGDQARKVWGEDSSFPALTDQALVHAAIQGRWLVVLGDKGVYRYDLETRSWSQLAPQAPDAFAAVNGGQEVLLSIGLQSYRLADGVLTPGAKLGERLVQILPLASGRVLGLDRRGQTVELTGDMAPILLAADPGLPKGAQLTKGAAGQGIVVLWGPQGLLLHDPKSRRYAFQTWDDLQLSPDDLEIHGDDASLWLIQPRAGLAFEASVAGDWPDKRLDLGAPPKPVALGGAPVAAEVSGGNLVVTLADGSSQTIAPGGAVTRIPGEALDGAFSPQVAMAYGTGLLFTDGPRLRAYDESDRGWSGVPDLPEPQATGLGLSAGRLYASTTSGRLYAIGPGQSDWSVVMGAGAGAAVGLDQLTDARGGPMAYVAGDGKVAGYDPSAHGFTASWSGGRGAVSIIGLQGSTPIWLSGARLFSGEEPLAPPGDKVLAAAMAGPAAVFLAEGQGRRYLALAGAKEDPSTCLFRGGPAPAGALRDALALPDGRVLAFTDQGAGLHDDATRRWIGVEGRTLEPGEDLALISGEVLRGDGRSLMHLPLARIAAPDSCDPAPLSPHWEAPASRSALIDRASDRALILGTDGAAGYWPGTKGGEVLPAPTTGPDISAMVQVDAVSGGLEFLGLDGLYSYDLGRRTWSSRSLEGLPDGIDIIDRAAVSTAAGAPEVLTLTLQDGSTWGADLPDLQPRKLNLPNWPRIGIAPDRLLDLAQAQGMVLALGQDGIELQKDGKVQTWPLDPSGTDWSLAEIPGAERIAAVLGDPAAPRRLVIFGKDISEAPFTYNPGTDRAWALDDKETLWRIDRDQVLWSCKVTAGSLAPGDCERRAEAPLPVTAGAMVDAAASGPGWLLALQDGRLLRLGADLRSVAEVQGPRMTADGRLVTLGGQVFAWEGPGGALWQVAEDAPRRLADAILALLPEGERLFVETPGGLAEVVEGAVKPITTTRDGATVLQGASLAGGKVFGVDAEGHMQSEEGKRAALGLPPLRGEILAVVPGQVLAKGAQTAWWVQRREGIELSWGSTCPMTQPLRTAAGSESFEARALPLPGVGQARCILNRKVSPIPDGSRLAKVQVDSGKMVLSTATGSWELAADGTLMARSPAPNPPSRPLSQLRSELAEVDGQTYLRPPSITATTNLVVRGMVKEVVATGGHTLVPPQAFVQQGIAWDRSARQVVLGASAVALRLSPAEAFPGGVFLPARPGMAAYLGQGRFALANDGGIWQLGASGLSGGTAMALPPVIGLSRGIFLTAPDRGYLAREAQPVQAQDPAHLRLGKLTLSQTLWPRTVAARLEVDGQSLEAAADRGFAFDDRQAFVQVAGQPAVATPLGLVSVQDFSATWPLPAGVQRFGLEGQELRAEVQGGAWLALTGGGWVASEAPGRTATLAEDAFRLWRRVDGRAEVVPRDPAQPWAVGSGLDFPTDEVRALGGAAGQGLVVLTAIGTETGQTLAELGPTRGAVAPAPGADALLSQEVAPGQGIVAAETAQGWQVWDAAAVAWRAPAGPTETPWEARLALDMQGMKIGFDTATPWARVAVTEPGGAPGERPFAWSRGEGMPFDQVTGLHSEADAVLVATGFGLRRLQGETLGGIYAADAGAGAAAPILALGRPAARPATIQVSAGAAGCLELSDALASPMPCAMPDPLDRRLVLDDGFWIWTEGRSGVEGAYRLAGGGLLPISATLPSRFPHDLLRDRSLCAGLDAELWQDGSALTVSGPGGRRIEPLSGAEDLWCQGADALLEGGAKLPAGLYVTSAGQAAAVTAQGLSPLPYGPDIAQRASGQLPWEEGRLRLVVQGGGIEVEAYRQSGTWQRIGWSDGRMALDRVLGLMRQGDDVLALTPAGALPVALSGPVLDLADLSLATTADPAVLAACAPSRIESRDGLEQAMPADPKTSLALACADGSALGGAWSRGLDLGALGPADDLLPARILVDAANWTITRPVAKGLSFAFRGEEIPLSGGRFSFDALSQVVPGFGPELHSIGSDGWWTWSAGGISTEDLARPAVKADLPAISGLWPDRVEGAPALCFHDGEAGAVALDASGRLRNRESCRRAVGQDALWSWWQGEDGPMASATASNGPEVQRSLEEGRFADLWAIGAARLSPEGDIVLPTKVGGLVLRDAVPHALYVSSGPTALWADGQGALAFVGAAERIPLAPGSDSCPGLTTYLASLGPGAGLRRIDKAAPDAALVWSETGETVQALVTCTGKGDHADWMVLQDVTDRARFQAGSPIGGDWLVTKAAREGMKAGLTKGGTAEVSSPIAGPLKALLPAPDGRAVLVVSAGDLYRMNVDPMLSQIADTGNQGARPAPSPTSPSAPTPDPEPQVPPTPLSPTPLSPTPLSPAPPSPGPATAAPAIPAPQIPAPVPPAQQAAPQGFLTLRAAEIEQVQLALRMQGYSVGKPDGILGPRTERAIQAWKADRGIASAGPGLTALDFQRLVSEVAP